MESDRFQTGIWLPLLLLLLSSQFAHAGSVALTAESTRLALDQGALSYFRDPTAQRTLDEVRAVYQEQRFKPISGNLGLGFTGDAVWLAIEVMRSADAPVDWVLQVEPPSLDLVELFTIRQQDPVQKQISGDGVPVALRSLPYRAPALAVQLEEGHTLLLLRMKSSSQMTAIPILSQRSDFDRSATTDSLVLGLFFGAIILVLVYNLVIWGLIHQTIYLLYCAYVLVQILYWSSFDGLLGLYLLPDNPLLANQIMGVALSVNVSVGIYFYARLLRVEARYRISHALLIYGYLTGIVSAVSVFFGLFQWVLPWMLLAVLLSFPALAPHAVRRIRTGHRVDQIFGAIYLLHGIMVLIDVLGSFTLLPTNLWTAYFAQIGQIVHVLALHLGFYYQVRAIERQRDEARIKLGVARGDADRERGRRREQDQLLQMIGHEVRTPLAIIASTLESLQLMEQEAMIDSENSGRYKRLHRAINRMESLIQMVGVNARALREASGQSRVKSVDFSRLCHDTLVLLVDGAERIRLHPPPDWNPRIQADEQMLSFALLNLYDNALKYSLTEDGIETSLYSRREGDSDGVCLRICNPAFPLASGMETRIFEKFVRADEHANEPGLGLGLYLARRITEQHEGWLRAYNQGEDRVCLELWLPLETEA